MSLEQDNFVIVNDDDFVMVSHKDADAQEQATSTQLPYLDDISRHVDSMADSLWPVNNKIHDHPELGYEEVIAHEALTSFMESQPGWIVTRSAYGLKTAWVAVYDSGKKGPVVSFNAEMDALPGIGHACGHNLIASASVAAALATAEVMTRHHLNGKIVLFGTPAEEGGGGKIALLRAGAYSSHKVDISLLAHPGTARDSALVRTTAYSRFRAAYTGREAHAAAEPWKGINALDALITGYNAVSALRQQTMPGDVIQGHITDGGAAPNIIHAHAAGVFVVRARTQARLDVLRRKVEACFAAGATATGAALGIAPLGAYADHVPSRLLGARYAACFNALCPPVRIIEDQDVDEIAGATMASSDQGDVSYAVPSLMPGFSIAGESGPHTPGFAKAAGTREAFERAMRAGKALAGTAADVLAVEGLREEVWAEWRRWREGEKGGN
ncbi:hypothetical protein B0T22DRAFT_34330 [Podospora appendiculata]|uniref:Peptidase M20 domain-containing protein 2 n=1 Tax=Podospora appendiculata TaxID=314037 RepID=A0AAE0XGT8_9PEZI|nr:hypothetical protein B0T22DRAFT_34330 [Podospora appendiculata]